MKKIVLALTMLTTTAVLAQNNAATTTAATPAQTTTGTVEAAKPAEAKKWGVELLTQSEGSAKASFLDGEISTLGFVAAKYKMDEKNRFAIRGYFASEKKDVLVNSGNASSFSKDTMQAIYGRQLGSLAKSNPVDFQLKYTLPLTTEIQAVANNGVVKTQFDIVWDLTTKMQLEYLIAPKLGMNTASEKNYFGLTDNYAALSYNLNDNLSFYQTLGLSTAKLSDISNSKMVNETGVNFAPVKSLLLSVYLGQEHSIGAGATSYALLNPEESKVGLIMDLNY